MVPQGLEDKNWASIIYLFLLEQKNQSAVSVKCDIQMIMYCGQPL